MAYNKSDKAGYATLRTWAEEEMRARGIEIK
jgi:hypothetical protein